MLPGYADSCSNVDPRVETFVPLLVAERVLLERVECALLLVNGSEWVLVLGLGEYRLFNELEKGQGIIVGLTCSGPVGVVLHLVQ